MNGSRTCDTHAHLLLRHLQENGWNWRPHILSKVSQTQRRKYAVFSHLWKAEGKIGCPEDTGDHQSEGGVGREVDPAEFNTGDCGAMTPPFCGLRCTNKNVPTALSPCWCHYS